MSFFQRPAVLLAYVGSDRTAYELVFRIPWPWPTVTITWSPSNLKDSNVLMDNRWISTNTRWVAVLGDDGVDKTALAVQVCWFSGHIFILTTPWLLKLLRWWQWWVNWFLSYPKYIESLWIEMCRWQFSDSKSLVRNLKLLLTNNEDVWQPKKMNPTIKNSL